MSEKEITKQAFAEAEKEAREKQVKEVKKIVTKTLEKLEDVRKELKELHEEEKILKMDIEDLREGKLDRIAERQEKDPDAKKVSVVVIIKEREVIRDYSPWYFPYQVIWQVPYHPVYGDNTIMNYKSSGNLCNDVVFNGGVTTCNAVMTTATNGCVGTTTPTINCSVAKDAVIGAYEVYGHVTHLR